MDVPEYLVEELIQHREVLAHTLDSVGAIFVPLCDACAHALSNGHKILFFGNGGSAADAQHLATELTVRYRTNRAAMSAIALTTDSSALTAIGNDFGFDELFARQIQSLCRDGDVAIGLSTSGNSENVIRAFRTARQRGAVTAGFTGGNGGRLLECVDYALIVPSSNTARIQEMHILLGHVLCGVLEAQVAEVLTDEAPGARRAV